MESASRDQTKPSSSQRSCTCHHQQQQNQGNNHTNDSASNPSSTRAIGSTLCPSCIKAYLSEVQERRTKLLREHAYWKQQCQDTLTRTAQRPSWEELQHKLKGLHQKSERLRKVSTQTALETARLACQNEERKAKLLADPIVQQRQWLARWQSSMLDSETGSETPPQTPGALSCALLQTRHAVRRIRFQWAVQSFVMHRLDVPEVKKMTSRMKHARGIGKIGGLPLPHAGPELYGVLPPLELQSALRLVASLTASVAGCLGIRLPHPILLTPVGPVGDLASQADEANHSSTTPFAISSSPPPMAHTTSNTPSPSSTTTASLTASTASLLSYAKNALTGSTPSRSNTAVSDPQHFPHRNNGHSGPTLVVPPSLQSSTVQKRIHHAMAAVLAEHDVAVDSPNSQGTATQYSLSVSAMKMQTTSDDEFAIALQLLQNNIVALCIRAGAAVADLWPAEAVLLNLHVLHEFCKQQGQQGG